MNGTRRGAAARKILIVDDEPGILDPLCSWLSGEGYQVVTATAGDVAIGLIAKINPDLVIADIKMSPVDGMQVLRAAKKQDPLMAVIMMTGHLTTVEHAVDAMKQGADDYICKPFQLKDLGRRVEYALRYQTILRQRQGQGGVTGRAERMVKLSEAMDAAEKHRG